MEGSDPPKSQLSLGGNIHQDYKDHIMKDNWIIVQEYSMKLKQGPKFKII